LRKQGRREQDAQADDDSPDHSPRLGSARIPRGPRGDRDGATSAGDPKQVVR
jgi:hypothetical protein